MTSQTNNIRRAVNVLLVLAAAYLLLRVFGVNVPTIPGPYGDGYYIVGVFMLMATLAIPALLIAVLVSVLLGRRSASDKTPLDIAKERYARGEIDRQAYEDILDVLTRS